MAMVAKQLVKTEFFVQIETVTATAAGTSVLETPPQIELGYFELRPG
jgi:hypothetical protein